MAPAGVPAPVRVPAQGFLKLAAVALPKVRAEHPMGCRPTGSARRAKLRRPSEDLVGGCGAAVLALSSLLA